MNFIFFYKEIINRLIYLFISFILTFLILLYNMDTIFYLLTSIFNKNNTEFIFENINDIIYSYIYISFFISIFIHIPIIYIHFLLFIIPALFKFEKKLWLYHIFLDFFFFSIIIIYNYIIPIYYDYFINMESKTSIFTLKFLPNIFIFIKNLFEFIFLFLIIFQLFISLLWVNIYYRLIPINFFKNLRFLTFSLNLFLDYIINIKQTFIIYLIIIIILEIYIYILIYQDEKLINK